jgi:hypothetical protein
MTTEQAELEIERLQKLIAKNKQSDIPKPLETPDFTYLSEIAQSYIREIVDTGFTDEDTEHWFFEAVMESVYGNKVFEWINKNSR